MRTWVRLVMNTEQIEEITRLRGLKLSPKQIARKLGVRPAIVNAILKEQVEQLEKARRDGRLLAPLEKCLINDHAKRQLLDSLGAPGQLSSSDGNNESGLAQIVVTRFEKNRYIFASYFVDYYCLGVKNVIGPMRLSESRYAALLKKEYQFFDGIREISLPEAQGILFGAVEYAKKLGFDPHPDWWSAKGHLGQPALDLPTIEFGRAGKPFVSFGLNDDRQKILATLKETVGEGNFVVDCDPNYTQLENNGLSIFIVD